MGLPSVCYEYVLLPLVNKEVALGIWQDRINLHGKSEQRYREKVVEVRKMACSCQRRQTTELYLVSHRIIEIG